MHQIQEKLLRVANDKDISGLTLREIGDLVGETSPQRIKHHLEQLETKGFMEGRRAVRPYENINGIVKIPIIKFIPCSN